MQVDIRQERRDHRPLRRADRAFGPRVVLQNAGLQPFADETQDTLVADPVFQETHQPVVADRIERSLDRLPTITRFQSK